MNGLFSKSDKEIINRRSIILVSIISVLSLVITISINLFNEKLYIIFVESGFLSNIGIQKFWSSDSISNLNLYIFTAQMTLSVLVGTAVSFVAHLLENKNYGYKIKDILTYRVSIREPIITDYVLINFILIFNNLLLLLMKFSEVAILIIFCITLYNTIKVFIIIFNVFFNESYLKTHTILMIRSELDTVKVAQKGEDSETKISSNYSKVDSILNIIKNHTIEVLRGANYEEYIENVDLVCKLGVEFKVEATNDIVTSVLYGWFIEKIALYLYENKFEKEIQELANHKLIKLNCDPTKVKIDDSSVAQMYSSHYCIAFLEIHRYNFSNNLSKKSLGHGNTINLLVDGFNEMYDLSSSFENSAYSNMNKNNWINFILSSMSRIEASNGEYSKQALKKFVSELERVGKRNSWAVEVLNSYYK